MSAVARDLVLGYAIYELRHSSLLINNLAVDPDYQKTGIGRAMIDKLKSKLNPLKRTKLKILIRETNLSGIRFFKNQKFRVMSLIRDSYPEENQDGILMQYQIFKDLTEL